MATQQQRNYWQNVSLQATEGLPSEDLVYAVFSDSIITLKTPPHRFSLHSQMRLKWKPNVARDRRYEAPDFGIINYDASSPSSFRLRLGAEAKAAIKIMEGTPDPSTIKNRTDVEEAFSVLRWQAEDQAKTAIKNELPLQGSVVDWILLVGPYWMVKRFGPFSEAQLTVRAQKPSESGDFKEAVRLQRAKVASPPSIPELYLLGTTRSFQKLEQLISSTDELAAPYMARILLPP